MPKWFRIYRAAAAALLYLEFAIGVNFCVHLPPTPEPWYLKTPVVIIPQPPNPYEHDVWWDTWESYFI